MCKKVSAKLRFSGKSLRFPVDFLGNIEGSDRDLLEILIEICSSSARDFSNFCDSWKLLTFRQRIPELRPSGGKYLTILTYASAVKNMMRGFLAAAPDARFLAAPV